MKQFKREQYKVSGWSGGKTVQIAISPEGADYADRDFLWRLSSATVELDESDFTALPDYERWIAPLRGEMRLSHNAGEAVTLGVYEIHRFDGADDTHAWGRCTDFNLMLRKGRCTGEIAALLGQTGERKTLSTEAELILYCAAGAVEVCSNGTCAALVEQEAIQFTAGEAGDVTLHFTSTGCVMAAQMREEQ